MNSTRQLHNHNSSSSQRPQKPAKRARKWGAPDVGYRWHCAGDFAFMKALHPNLRLERTKTCMMGDDCYDFKMIWEEKE